MLLPEKTTSYKDILFRFDELKSEKPELIPFLEQLGNILTEQEKIKEAFSPDIGAINIDEGLKRNAEGNPFLDLQDIKVDPDLFNSMLAAVAEKTLSAQEETNELIIPEDDRDQLINTIVSGILNEDSDLLISCAEKYNIPAPIFIFCAHQTLIPFLEAYAEQIRSTIDQSKWIKSRCPACGGGPLMAKYEGEGGKKMLQCGLCRTEWLFKRLECTFCGNSEQTTLRYFFDEKDPSHRVDICEKCKSYLKAVDVRELAAETNLIVEDALTLRLDIAAKQEGYSRNGS